MKKLLNNKAFLWTALCVCALLAGIGAAKLAGAAALFVKPAPTPVPAPAATPVLMPTAAVRITPPPTPKPTPTPTPYVPPEELNIAREINPHVIAWLEIPGMEIRYPVLMHPTEDNHYLNITIDGAAGYPGSIYTNSMEGADFDTFNTVIYGHNMADGTYFGSLKSYFDSDFYAAHREIDIYTPTAKHVYKIFAVVTYDDRYITDSYNDKNEADRMAFLESLAAFGAAGFDDVAVDAGSHIITLSTCIGGMPSNRLLIVAAEQEPVS